MTRKLKNTLRKFDKEKENKPILISGELGIPLNGNKTVEVPNRRGFVFVRLKGNTSELIQAYNASVSPIYGLPVLVGRQGNVYKVVGRNLDRYQDWGNTPYLPKHGAQHSFNHELGVGGDITWIFSQQFMPLLNYPSGTSGGMTLSLEPHFYEWNGQWRYAQNTGTPSYAPYLPTVTGSARMVLSYIDPVNNSIKLVPGTPFSGLLTGSADIAQYIPDIPREIGLPLSAVRLTTGTTSIGWDAIYDLRDFYTVGKPSGSVGGGGGSGLGIVGQDEGVFVATGTVLNVVGTGGTLTASGTVLRLEVTSSGVTDAEFVTSAAHAGLSAEVVVPGMAGSPDIASANGSVFSYEFDDTSTVFTWDVAPDTVNSDTTLKSHLYMTNNDATTRYGLIPFAPTGTFDVRMKVAVGSDVSSGSNNAIGISIQNSDGSLRILLWYIVAVTVAAGLYTVQAYTYDTGAYTQRGTTHNTYDGELYLRVTRDNSNNVSFWYSTNGKAWRFIVTHSHTLTVSHVGIRTASDGAINSYHFVDWFRAG